MSDVVIRAEGLGKKYLIGHEAGRVHYMALRDVLARSAKGLLRSALDMARGQQLVIGDEVEEFWALKDVSFEIKRGDVVGIIGRNGAGKSTLLKILSRITEPSAGRVELRGRMASLLEVGTGFHQELTGRENIRLNGAILGMSGAEIARKFDEIVDFAGVEKFIDTPVKHYSSGMQVRLAFAVAAHLEPEVLLVDEVLAVGDADFQKKSIGKMGEVAREGRTVLFVSHHMAAIRSFCRRSILLTAGSVVAEGATDDVVAKYLESSSVRTTSVEFARTELVEVPQIVKIMLQNPNCQFGDTLQIEMHLVSGISVAVALEIEIHDDKGVPIAYTSSAPMHSKSIMLNPGVTKKITVSVGPLNLASGIYRVFFWLIKPWVQTYQIVREPLEFRMVTSDPGQTGFEFKSSYGRGCFTVGIEVAAA